MSRLRTIKRLVKKNPIAEVATDKSVVDGRKWRLASKSLKKEEYCCHWLQHRRDIWFSELPAKINGYKFQMHFLCAYL
jgi:hypothetical protein